MPISETEAMRILHHMREGRERPQGVGVVRIGENVPWPMPVRASFSVRLEESTRRRSRVKVAVSIFGAPAGRTGIRSGRKVT